MPRHVPLISRVFLFSHLAPQAEPDMRNVRARARNHMCGHIRDGSSNFFKIWVIRSARNNAVCGSRLPAAREHIGVFRAILIRGSTDTKTRIYIHTCTHGSYNLLVGKRILGRAVLINEPTRLQSIASALVLFLFDKRGLLSDGRW